MANQACDQRARALQKAVFAKLYPGRAVNSFRPAKAPSRVTLSNGTVYVNDICYGTQYPNSYLDIWYSPLREQRRCPTYIYLHGGGYLFGDKITGDPLATEAKLDNVYFKDLSARGFHVVSANYCFAPRYRAPAQFRQLNGMLAYLAEHADELGLDMQNVVLGGGSAGANFTAVYGLALCDPEYAKKIGVQVAIERERFKALVIDEAALDRAENAKSEGLCVMGLAWLGEKDMATSKKMALYDVGKQIRGDYIPAYLTASNVEPVFQATAESIVRALRDAGVEYEYYYRTQEESEPLNHGFMNQFPVNAFARECYENMVQFISRKTGLTPIQE